MGLHDGHRQRKRQQFLSHGPQSMADHELLELALFYAIPRRDTNEEKMANVYNAHPEFKGMVDRILTGEMFARSKPAPDCFLLGMEIFEATPENSYVFEDSFHGLQAGMTSGATVIGLATTNSREAITGKAHYIIDDFTGMTYEKMISFHK